MVSNARDAPTWISRRSYVGGGGWLDPQSSYTKNISSVTFLQSDVLSRSRTWISVQKGFLSHGCDTGCCEHLRWAVRWSDGSVAWWLETSSQRGSLIFPNVPCIAKILSRPCTSLMRQLSSRIRVLTSTQLAHSVCKGFQLLCTLLSPTLRTFFLLSLFDNSV